MLKSDHSLADMKKSITFAVWENNAYEIFMLNLLDQVKHKYFGFSEKT